MTGTHAKLDGEPLTLGEGGMTLTSSSTEIFNELKIRRDQTWEVAAAGSRAITLESSNLNNASVNLSGTLELKSISSPDGPVHGGCIKPNFVARLGPLPWINSKAPQMLETRTI